MRQDYSWLENYNWRYTSKEGGYFGWYAMSMTNTDVMGPFNTKREMIEAFRIDAIDRGIINP